MTHWTLVTGANRGLGLEFVRQLLADGARVVATCRHPGKATALNTLVAEHPGHLKVLPLDVADARSREELVREWPLAAGEDARIELLVNNAGVLHSGERFGTLTADTLDDSLRTNVTGPLLLTQALAPLLADGARVANLSSQLGSIANTTRFGTTSESRSRRGAGPRRNDPVVSKAALAHRTAKIPAAWRGHDDARGAVRRGGLVGCVAARDAFGGFGLRSQCEPDDRPVPCFACGQAHRVDGAGFG